MVSKQTEIVSGFVEDEITTETVELKNVQVNFVWYPFPKLVIGTEQNIGTQAAEMLYNAGNDLGLSVLPFNAKGSLDIKCVNTKSELVSLVCELNKPQ